MYIHWLFVSFFFKLLIIIYQKSHERSVQSSTKQQVPSLRPRAALSSGGPICIGKKKTKQSVLEEGMLRCGGVVSSVERGGSQSGDGPHPPAVGSQTVRRSWGGEGCVGVGVGVGGLLQPQSCPHSMLLFYFSQKSNNWQRIYPNRAFTDFTDCFSLAVET